MTKKILALLTATAFMVCSVVPASAEKLIRRIPGDEIGKSNVPEISRTQPSSGEDSEFKLLRDTKRGVNVDFSMVKVRINTGGVPAISFKLYGAYYIAENLRPAVGSAYVPYTVSFSVNASGDGVTAVDSTGKELYSGSKITLMRVNLNSSAGYAQLDTNGSSNDNVSYLGNFIISANTDGSIRLINDIPTAHYLYGIVPYEMSEIWNIEALKAQAVAAKTFAFGFTLPGDDYDITDSFNYQGYRGYKPGFTKCMQACVDVCGKILSVDDQIMLTFYGATNGGETQLPSYAFSSSAIDDLYEIRLDERDFEFATSKRRTLSITYGEAPTEPLFAELLADEAAKVLGTKVSVLRINDALVHEQKYPDTLRNLTRLKIVMDVADSDGNERSVTVDFDVSKLKSCGLFTEKYLIYWGKPTETGYEVYFCRWGHGLGLSQWGAQARALDGESYEDILGFYYSKFSLTDVAESNPEEPYSYTLKPLAYGTVNVTAVNMRSGPGVDYPIVAQFARGEHLDIIGEKDSWLICIGKNRLGYIRGDFIDIDLFPAPENAEAVIGQAKTTSDTMLYDVPSVYDDPLFTIPANSYIYIWNTIGDWYYVRVSRRYGFIRREDAAIGKWFVIDMNRLYSGQISDKLVPKP